MALTDIVFGDISPKVGSDSPLTFLLRVGDGSTVFLRHDQWCEEAPLRELPALFVFALDRDASVAYY